jgi:hypothetical protein
MAVKRTAVLRLNDEAPWGRPGERRHLMCRASFACRAMPHGRMALTNRFPGSDEVRRIRGDGL